eukprot:5063336-Pleurochrysis_carterae.AAC.1
MRLRAYSRASARPPRDYLMRCIMRPARLFTSSFVHFLARARPRARSHALPRAPSRPPSRSPPRAFSRSAPIRVQSLARSPTRAISRALACACYCELYRAPYLTPSRALPAGAYLCAAACSESAVRAVARFA